MRRLRLTGIVLLSVMLGLACTKKSTTAPTAVAAKTSASATQSAILNFHLNFDPEYLDPGLISEDAGNQIAQALYEGLVQHRAEDLTIEPALAERWEQSEDQRSYLFHLRPGIRWSDGTPITAHDFVFAWERVLNPATASKTAFLLYHIKNGRPYNQGKLTDAKQLGVQAIDDTTLQVTLENPTPFFMQLILNPAFLPVPRHVVAKHGADWVKPAHFVTGGPFLLQEWTPYKWIRVAKNTKYWAAERVHLDQIVFHIVEDQETSLKMYDAGTLDIIWQAPPAKIAALKARPDFIVAPYASVYYYHINVEAPPMQQQALRQALGLAIDRQILTKQFLHDVQVASPNMVPVGIAGYPYAEGLAFNPERARAVLKEAGVDPAKLPTITVQYNTLDLHKTIAEVLQQMWKQHLGITVQLQNQEWKTLIKTYNTRQYQLGRYGWVADYVDPNSFLEIWMSDSTENHTGWANADYDRLMHAAAREADPQQRFARLAEAERILLREAPVLPLFTHARTYLLKPQVKGYYPTLRNTHPFKYVWIEAPTSAQR